MRAYSEYRAGPESDLLGRFVVSSSRLRELDETAQKVLTRSEPRWSLSIVASSGPLDSNVIADFNRSHAADSDTWQAHCDAIEMPVHDMRQIELAIELHPPPIELFLEVPLSDPNPLIAAIAGTRAAAKVRTGGVLEGAIPAARDVLVFIRSCVSNGVRFKATAGLHHPLRASYPLTYEPDSPRATMFGFLNIFLAAAFCADGLDDESLIALLDETVPSSIVFDDRGVRWRGNRLSHSALLASRQSVALSFGSCSFTEPVTETRGLGFI